MTMTRRLFARALGAAPLAAQALSSGNVAGGIPGGVPPLTDYAKASAPSYDHGGYLRKQVGELRDMIATGTLDEEDRIECRNRALRRLDPDIKALRSFSGVAKLALQQEREEQRMMGGRRGHWQRVLAERLQELAGLKG